MRKWILGICAVVLGGAIVIEDVEARRLGGGRAAGTQRSMTNPPAQQKVAPAQQQQTGQQQAGQQQAAAQQQGGSRWAPILGGLALGGLLGYLFSGSGLGVLVLLALLTIGAVIAFRMLAQRRESPQPMQYAGTGLTGVPPAQPSQGMAASVRAALPAGFDGAAFLKGAKMNFIKLQAANDAGRMEDIREFTTDEMFAELKGDLDARAGAAQHTDVVSLDAQLVEVTTEGDQHWASVQFSGLIRETQSGEAEEFREVWNLVKPADGSSGWLLAGIQQMH